MIHELARQVRRDTIRMIVNAGSGHVGGALGVADILTVLYEDILHYRPDEPDWQDRDRLVLSNGHICAAWYSILARTGHFPIDELATHRRFGSRLQGHPARAKLGKLVETSSGPLGQGLSVANGLALSMRADARSARVFCILGDGELAEGQVWEAAMTAGHYRLSNAVAIILANGLQIDGTTEAVKRQEPIDRRFAAFGWETTVVDGHNPDELQSALATVPSGSAPRAVVARVKMAAGVSAWEDQAKWHGTTPDRDAALQALEEIGLADGYDDFPIEGTAGGVL
ncbi:MAG: transketolase [Spirochaeta sp.]|nr:transketolase [Spirochaeta sp.]